MAEAKARDKGHNNQPLSGVAKARWQMMKWVEDATTNQLRQRRAAADNESKRIAADNGRQKWDVAVNNVELTIAPQRLASTRMDGNNRASKGRHTTQQLTII